MTRKPKFLCGQYGIKRNAATPNKHKTLCLKSAEINVKMEVFIMVAEK